MRAKGRRPEMTWNEKTQLYCKKVKDESTGKWVPVYGHTKEETREKVDLKKADLAAAAELRENPLFYVYARKWYSLHTGGYSEKRKQDYQNAINNHICPVLGAMQLRDVSYSDVMLVMAGVAGKSKSLQQKVVTSLRRIFDAAVQDGLLEESPCGQLRPGGQDALEKVALTKPQQAALLDAVAGKKIFPFVALCLYAGLRREEALGLQWRDVHLDGDAPWIEVRSSCTWEGRNKPKLSPLLKSDAAYRSIPIPPQLVEILKPLRASAKGNCVCCVDDGGLMSAAAFRRRWEAVTLREVRTLKRKVRGQEITQELRLGDPVPYHAGVTVSLDFHTTPHLLRHTYISELILGGVSIKRVQYLAGHSSPIQTLKIYTHLMENRPEDLYAEILKAFPAGITSA